MLALTYVICSLKTILTLLFFCGEIDFIVDVDSKYVGFVLTIEVGSDTNLYLVIITSIQQVVRI